MASLGRIYTLDEIKSLVLPVFRKHKVNRAYVFGSYAKGCPTCHSDLDLLVECDIEGLEFFGIHADLFDIFGDGAVDIYDIREIIMDSPLGEEIENTKVCIYNGD